MWACCLLFIRGEWGGDCGNMHILCLLLYLSQSMHCVPEPFEDAKEASATQAEEHQLCAADAGVMQLLARTHEGQHQTL
jgi:hypothetical protein